MKHLITLVLLLTSLFVQAQEADSFTGDADNHPRNPQQDQISFVPNEVLVKFRDDVQVNGGTLLKSAGIKAVDRLFQDRGIEELEKLFPTETRLKSARVVKDPHGQDMVIPSLHNIYKIVLPQLKSTQTAPPDIFELLRELNELPEVEYAEPNYIFSIGDFTPEGPEMSMLEAMEQPANYNISEEAAGLIPNDPLYNSQWGIPATKIDVVWNTTTGDETQVIGILDTGVDWTHPDLAANIWANPQEIPGNGIDDDGNGYIDDIRGWDFINHDNNPMDDNSHGTHVAGIAAAVGNNGIGIAGVNWKAKIMPIKVFQSSGRGDAATIAQGVTYAITKGATVLNMSFGSYAESLTLKNALANAYATAVLVAAAGNDGRTIGPCLFCYPFFPAAYSFVLGVEATKQIPSTCGNGDPIIRACFSNYDPDGPVFSGYPELYNFELKAPGASILSTIPGGNYRLYSGTSMSAPLVAGAVSIYSHQKQFDSKELLFGNLIQASGLHFDLDAALNIQGQPNLDIISFELTDTLSGDGDGRPDAGEIVDIFVKVRNSWEQANEVYVGLELDEFEDPSVIQVIQNTAIVGSISAYASRVNAIPLKIKISEETVNNREIVLNLKTWYNQNEGLKAQQIILKVEKGKELSGLISKDSTLSAGNLWLVNSSLRIGTGVTLTLEPGAHLQINAGLDNRGTISAIGLPEKRIKIDGGIMFPPTHYNGIINLEYVDWDLRKGNINANAKYCNFTNGLQIGGGNYELSSFIDFTFSGIQAGSIYGGTFNHCFFNNFVFNENFGIFYNSVLDKIFVGSGRNTISKHTVYNNIDNSARILFPWNPTYSLLYPAFLFELYSTGQELIIHKNSLLSHAPGRSYFVTINGTDDSFTLPNQYWGTTDTLKIRKKVLDFWQDVNKPFFYFNPILTQPSDSCHAHVWKVLLNGKDIQDEKPDPIGVGTHRFDVYFNRAMDKNITPNVSFGVRYPFTQQSVNEEGSWSEDGKIYTAYKTVKLTTGDGINRVRVSGAKEADGWDWEIPVEDQRFEFLVSAASSASNEFMATPGLGKVDLEWNDNDLEDGLGYNMYRMEQINDSTLSEPVMINTTLITDTLYSDFAVVPNQKYFYYYKILRTSLEETDSSKVVAAVPFTASLGDANGDLVVNVLDVTSIVAYLLNQDPKPFIFEAADVNGDQQINVLDIVATVNLVLNPTKAAITASTETVSLYMVNDTLFADAPVAIGAIQFDITGVEGISDIERLSGLNGFESGFSVNDQTLRLIVYSLTGKTIPAGNRIPLLKLKKGSGITQMVMGDKNGAPLVINYITTGLWNLSDLGDGVATLGQNYPNPFDRSTIIPVMIHEPVDEALIRIVNINGQQVAMLPLKNPVIGENLLRWEPGNNKGFMAYILEIRRNGQQVVSGVRKMIAR